MRVLLALTACLLVTGAQAAERVSPPLSTEGARAALAQAGVRDNALVPPLGPYRYQVGHITITSKSPNVFVLEVRIKSLPMQGQ